MGMILWFQIGLWIEGDYYWLCSIEGQHVTAHAGHVHMKQATSILMRGGRDNHQYTPQAWTLPGFLCFQLLPSQFSRVQRRILQNWGSLGSGYPSYVTAVFLHLMRHRSRNCSRALLTFQHHPISGTQDCMNIELTDTTTTRLRCLWWKGWVIEEKLLWEVIHKRQEACKSIPCFTHDNIAVDPISHQLFFA